MRTSISPRLPVNERIQDYFFAAFLAAFFGAAFLAATFFGAAFLAAAFLAGAFFTAFLAAFLAASALVFTLVCIGLGWFAAPSAPGHAHQRRHRQTETTGVGTGTRWPGHHTIHQPARAPVNHAVLNSHPPPKNYTPSAPQMLGVPDGMVDGSSCDDQHRGELAGRHVGFATR